LDRIPDTLLDLRASGAVFEQTYPRLVRELDERLNNRPWVIGCGGIGALIVAAFYVYSPMGCIRNWQWSCATLMPVDVLFGFAVAAVAWKACALAGQVSAWGRRGELTIRPFHPDGGAGVAPIGQLLLSLSGTLVAAGIFCAFWLLIAGRGPTRLIVGVDEFVPWLGLGFVTALVVSILAFVVPMLTVHRLMASKSREARDELAALAVAIAELDRSLVSRSTEITPERAEPELRRLRVLRDAYGELERIPTWPVDLRTRSTFALGLTVQVIGLISTAVVLPEKLKPFLRPFFR
jgi:hypothetical protein